MFPWKGQPAAEPQHENTTIIEVNNQLSTWCHFLSRIEHTIRKTYTSTWVHQAAETAVMQALVDSCLRDRFRQHKGLNALLAPKSQALQWRIIIALATYKADNLFQNRCNTKNLCLISDAMMGRKQIWKKHKETCRPIRQYPHLVPIIFGFPSTFHKLIICLLQFKH